MYDFASFWDGILFFRVDGKLLISLAQHFQLCIQTSFDQHIKHEVASREDTVNVHEINGKWSNSH